MPGRLRIFISSTMEDLANEREIVVDRLRSFNFEPVNAEGILPNGATSWERISEELDTCHLFVLILGERYGWVPTSGPLADAKLSVTHGEYRRARALKIPVLPFSKRLRYSAPRDSDDAKLRDRFREEIGEWASGQFRAEFDRGLELGEKVASAVTGLLSDAFQRTLVEQRMSHTREPVAQRAEQVVAIPEPLIEAVRRREVVLFAGSGISLAAGLPSSQAFAAQLMRGLHESDPNYTVPAVGSAFASLAGDFEVMYSRDYLAGQVRLLLEIPGAIAPTQAHIASVDLFPRIITTNYDELFERAIAIRNSRQQTIIAPDCPSPMPDSFLLKLHGSYTLPASLVITESDLATFETSHKGLLAQVAALLASKPVLVIGSSLRDPSVFRFFHTLDRRLRGYCLIPRCDALTTMRLRSFGMDPIEGSIESFFHALGEALHAGD